MCSIFKYPTAPFRHGHVVGLSESAQNIQDLLRYAHQNSTHLRTGFLSHHTISPDAIYTWVWNDTFTLGDISDVVNFSL